MIIFIVLLSFFCTNLHSAESTSQLRLTNKELTNVNEVIHEHISDSTLTPLAKLLFYSYLAQAQKEFAWESQRETGNFSGSFVPITIAIQQLFQPKALVAELEDRLIAMPMDARTQALVERISSSMKERLLAEGKGIKNYPVNAGTNPEELEGLNFGSLKTWNIKSTSAFRSPAPSEDKDFFVKQLEEVKKASQNLDGPKLAAIDFWAHQADWETIAENYMKTKNTPLEIRLNVRASLLTILSDTKGAVNDAKYTYWIPRPSFFDASIIPVVGAAKSPSYPSTASATATAATIVLAYYFPENKESWQRMAEEAGMTRIWAGLHFPMDHEEGKKLGAKIARAALLTPTKK